MSASAFSAVPPELKAIPRWLLWRWAGGSKVPTAPNSTRPASAHSPASWMSFEDARAALATSEPGWIEIFGEGGGLGFMPSTEDDVVFIDLDGCRDPETGAIAGWAQEAHALFGDAYTEISPSQTGLRILGRVADPVRPKMQVRVDVAPAVPGKDPYVEMYAYGQYCTITGQHYSGAGLIDCASAWDQLQARYAGDKAVRADRPTRSYETPDLAVVADALSTFSSDDVDRSTFIGFAQVLRHEYGEVDGFEVWAAWMAKSPNDDSAVTERMWNSVRGMPRSMTIGSIFWHAEQHGWVPPWRPIKATDIFDDGETISAEDL